jgi:hypothetical protein
MLRHNRGQYVLEGPAGTLPVLEEDEVAFKFAMLFEGECEGLGPTRAAKKYDYSKQRYLGVVKK